MIVFTDNVEFAKSCIPIDGDGKPCYIHAFDPPVRRLANELFENDSIMAIDVGDNRHWDYLFAVDRARQSQYDVLAALAGSGLEIPNRVLCCAGSGQRFHGFKGRSWQACRGNIHLSAYLEPGVAVRGGSAGFIIAAVTAALAAIEMIGLEDSQPVIKWVNDLLVRGAKVGGVLARLQTQRDVIKSAIVGIGLNVEKRPNVARDAYVPDVAALADFALDGQACRHLDVFPNLAEHLGRKLARLCDGEFEQLLDLYRKRSLIMNRHVTILEDRQGRAAGLVAEGKVNAIGQELELYIEGHTRPITKGRLILG